MYYEKAKIEEENFVLRCILQGFFFYMILGNCNTSFAPFIMY